MNKYKFLKISSSKKIRYLTNKYKEIPYVVFLHGFMSDVEGDKPKKILRYCKKKKDRFSCSRIFWTWKIFRQIYKWKC